MYIEIRKLIYFTLFQGVFSSYYSSASGMRAIRTKIPADNHRQCHDGTHLAARVQAECRALKFHKTRRPIEIEGSVTKQLLYCPMKKIGTTFWRRLFYMAKMDKGVNLTSPYDVPISNALRGHPNKISPSVMRELKEGPHRFFLFARNPFSRLLSAFVDKLVAPNPYYWKEFGSKAIRLFRDGDQVNSNSYGQDVTFQEFVKYVTWKEVNNTNTDPHLVSIFSRCKPCEINYTYIGTMETFQDDVYFILKESGMNDTLHFLSKGDTFQTLYVQDAIKDSIYSPFSWKNDIRKIITWEQALRRAWLKLQMRGIVALTETFNSYVTTDGITIDNITATQFIKAAIKAHKNSDPAELKRQKHEVIREAFMMLSYDELAAFRNAYSNDFKLFGYEDSPKLLFDRPLEKQSPSKYFNYSILN